MNWRTLEQLKNSLEWRSKNSNGRGRGKPKLIRKVKSIFLLVSNLRKKKEKMKQALKVVKTNLYWYIMYLNYNFLLPNLNKKIYNLRVQVASLVGFSIVNLRLESSLCRMFCLHKSCSTSFVLTNSSQVGLISKTSGG